MARLSLSQKRPLGMILHFTLLAVRGVPKVYPKFRSGQANYHPGDRVGGVLERPRRVVRPSPSK